MNNSKMIFNNMYSFEQTIRVSFDVVSSEYSTFYICTEFPHKSTLDLTIFINQECLFSSYY